MQLYNLWTIYADEISEGGPGPSFWAEVVANGGFARDTPFSLYTRFRDMVPVFRDIDK